MSRNLSSRDLGDGGGRGAAPPMGGAALHAPARLGVSVGAARESGGLGGARVFRREGAPLRRGRDSPAASIALRRGSAAAAL